MKIGIHKEPAGKGIGGTEYCVVVLAEELSKTHDVEIVHHQDWLTKDHLTALFDVNLERVELRHIPFAPWKPSGARLPWRKLRHAQQHLAEVSKPYELFISFTHGEEPPPFCHAGYGMMVVLFPIWDATKHARIYDEPFAAGSWIRGRMRKVYNEWEWKQRLASYGFRTAISYFSQQWTQRLWGVECAIFHPPVWCLCCNRPTANMPQAD